MSYISYTHYISKNRHRFITFETMNVLEAKGYSRKPRPGAAATPFISLGGRTGERAEPPPKRPRNAPEVADEFSSEQGKKKHEKRHYILLQKNFFKKT